jgi:hypothetical protein
VFFNIHETKSEGVQTINTWMTRTSIQYVFENRSFFEFQNGCPVASQKRCFSAFLSFLLNSFRGQEFFSVFSLFFSTSLRPKIDIEKKVAAAT